VASNLSGQDSLALAFQLPYALGEVADVFASDTHQRILAALLAFRELYLAFDLPEEFSESDLDRLEHLAEDYVQKLTVAFGPNSEFGFNVAKPKTHALSHLRYYITLHGAPAHWCTGSMETAHKTRTKDHAAKTNNQW
jgi:hypothetical protein